MEKFWGTNLSPRNCAILLFVSSLLAGCGASAPSTASSCSAASFTLSAGGTTPITSSFFPCGGINSAGHAGELVFTGQGVNPDLGFTGVTAVSAGGISYTDGVAVATRPRGPFGGVGG